MAAIIYDKRHPPEHPEAAKRRQEILRQDILRIDEQIFNSDAHNTKLGEGIPDEDSRHWRNSAVLARQMKERELKFLNIWIMKHDPEEQKHTADLEKRKVEQEQARMQAIQAKRERHERAKKLEAEQRAAKEAKKLERRKAHFAQMEEAAARKQQKAEQKRADAIAKQAELEKNPSMAPEKRVTKAERAATKKEEQRLALERLGIDQKEPLSLVLGGYLLLKKLKKQVQYTDEEFAVLDAMQEMLAQHGVVV